MNVLKLNIPTKLSELTADQLLYVSRLYLHGYSETEFLVKALLYLSGLKLSKALSDESGAYWCDHHSLKKPFILDCEQIARIKNSVSFILKPEEVKPIPRIGCARARQYRLYNASFEEYLMAENYYFAYVETKLPEHLDNLISCLYRRPWQQWNASKIQARAKQFKNVDPVVKNAVFMWYVGFRTYVPKRCKNLFSASSGSAINRRVFNTREYINGMIHQLNNGNITITDSLLKQPVWSALDELEQRAIDNDSK